MYAAIAQAEAQTRHAEVMETLLEEAAPGDAYDIARGLIRRMH